MPYAILRFEKRKGGPASALKKHHERKKNRYASNPDIDTEKSAENYHLIKPQHKYYGEIQLRIERAQRKNLKCKVRKDSVKFIDTIVTASPEFLAELSPEDTRHRKMFAVPCGFSHFRKEMMHLFDAHFEETILHH